MLVQHLQEMQSALMSIKASTYHKESMDMKRRLAAMQPIVPPKSTILTTSADEEKKDKTKEVRDSFSFISKSEIGKLNAVLISGEFGRPHRPGEARLRSEGGGQPESDARPSGRPQEEARSRGSHRGLGPTKVQRGAAGQESRSASTRGKKCHPKRALCRFSRFHQRKISRVPS